MNTNLHIEYKNNPDKCPVIIDWDDAENRKGPIYCGQVAVGYIDDVDNTGHHETKVCAEHELFLFLGHDILTDNTERCPECGADWNINRKVGGLFRKHTDECEYLAGPIVKDEEPINPDLFATEWNYLGMNIKPSTIEPFHFFR
jgi:hypothetical protein